MKRVPVFDNDLNYEAPVLDVSEKTLRQISVSDLAIGMYVEALDKPWSESAFLLQGFFIRSKQDIIDQRAECRFVTIDASIKAETQRQRHGAWVPELMITRDQNAGSPRVRARPAQSPRPTPARR